MEVVVESEKVYELYIKDRWRGKKDYYEVPFPIVAAMGLSGEVGEVMEHLKKHYRDGKHPSDKLKLELGDVLHYLVVIAQSYGWSLEDLMISNMEKLNKRDISKYEYIKNNT